MNSKAYRDLRKIAPLLVAEWDVERNGSNVLENFQNEYDGYPHWICSKGHKWQMRIDARTDQNQNCPYCSGRRIIPGETDLTTRFPDVAADWHHSRNDDLDPGVIAPFSHKFVWWVCPAGHEDYFQQISKRTGRGTSCPECSKGRGNSKGEFELGEFLKSLRIEYVQGSRKYLEGMELDFYVESKSVGIEYNGEFFHSDASLKPDSVDKTARDYHLRKLEQAFNRDLDLVFVWEHDWEEHQSVVKEAVENFLNGGNKDSILSRISSYKDIDKSCCEVRV